MDKLKELLDAYALPDEDRTLSALGQYLELLVMWNSRMDLTSVPDEDIPLRHFGDSLLPMLRYPECFPPGAHLCDVGTGAGFPGLVLAVARPDLTVTLMESLEKRCAFLTEAERVMKLGNVRVLRLRAEEAGQKKELRESFDLAVSRAVAALPTLLEYLLPLVRTGGAALCWKGPAAAAECEAAQAAAEKLGGSRPGVMPVPFPGEQRFLVRVDKISPTPGRYPRRPGIPLKRPL